MGLGGWLTPTTPLPSKEREGKEKERTKSKRRRGTGTRERERVCGRKETLGKGLRKRNAAGKDGRKGRRAVSYRDEWFKHNKSDHGWYTCERCGKKIRKADVDVDHIVPQKYGGSDRLFNLQCLCKHCNRSKQASMKDTVPDLVKTNGKRAVKSIVNKVKSALKGKKSK